MAGRASLQTTASASDLRELPPSAKLIAVTLAHEGELTQSQLAEATLLPARTVRSGLSQLEEAGLVTSRPSVMDARRQLYSFEDSDE
jgi:DNA-binding MarR family transcriptional regulator